LVYIYGLSRNGKPGNQHKYGGRRINSASGWWTNGLLRQYFRKGSDLCVYGPKNLEHVARELQGHPRETLGWDTPAERLRNLLLTNHLTSRCCNALERALSRPSRMTSVRSQPILGDLYTFPKASKILSVRPHTILNAEERLLGAHWDGNFGAYQGGDFKLRHKRLDIVFHALVPSCPSRLFPSRGVGRTYSQDLPRRLACPKEGLSRPPVEVSVCSGPAVRRWISPQEVKDILIKLLVCSLAKGVAAVVLSAESYPRAILNSFLHPLAALGRNRKGNIPCKQKDRFSDQR
jgi:hypothetical protein